jgi:hemoglobin
MRKLRWGGLSLLAVCLIAVTHAHGVAADEKADQKALDAELRRTLYGVIDGGASRWNRGQLDDCCHTYQSALLLSLRLLNHHPEIQKYIKDGLAEAERMRSIDDRALKLREVLDQVREDLLGGTPAGPVVPPAPKQKKTAWDRLGGEKGVAKIVDDFVASAAKDPKVNFDRNGKYKLDAAAVAKLKSALIAQISSLTEGPLKYEGDMKKVHKGMQITNAEFDAAAEHLRKALEDRLKTEEGNKALKADINRIIVKVEDLRNEIVESKKPEETPKKPEDTSKKPNETPKDGEVHGKVTVDGKPLPAGKISYFGADNKPITGDIKDGAYQLSGLKPGAYKITIEGDKINERYKLAETTPLRYKIIKEEKEPLNWELKP